MKRTDASVPPRTVCAVILGYLAAASGLFWPLVSRPTSQYWADGGDGAAFVWNFWSLPRAVFDLRDPFVTDHVFWPVGIHTAFNTNTPLLSIASYPLQLIIGLPATTTVLGLGAVVGSAIGAFFLARRVGVRTSVAWFAGLAFLLLPWRTNRLITHLNLIHTEFIVFALLAGLRFYERPTARRGAVVGLAVGAPRC